MTRPDSPPEGVPERLEPTLLRFIWGYSARHQVALLALTLVSFPILYASLELPKLILNDAIGGTSFPIRLLDQVALNQIPFLLLLCGAFLLTVLFSGLIKMRLNLYKGLVGERLLRRLRYRLITHVLRFPTSRFRRMSQGEVVSMITAEVEPLSGVMGDALANPAFQAGQMLTILTFLFIQNPWLGLAAIALVPLQAIITPVMQRRINRLHRERVRRVRKLSELIGESVHGLEDLRVNGGTPYALAVFSHRLGNIFQTRAQIFRKKFFMKFLNNFINNLPPFLFYSVGGYLVIEGRLSIGALVAAIAAYKDILSPWRELLNFISQIQETSDRYKSLVDQFEPDDIMDISLLEGQTTDSLPRLGGEIRFDHVSVTDPNGSPLLSDINLSVPAGKLVAVESANGATRRAFAQALSRSTPISAGRIEIGGQDLKNLHQSVISARIGVATSSPYLFNASVGENIFMPLRQTSGSPGPVTDIDNPDFQEALASGNSTFPVNAEWLDLEIAGFSTPDELRTWWLQLVDAMGSESYLFQRSLDANFASSDRPLLAQRLIEMRPLLARRLAEEKLTRFILRFDRNGLHESLTLAENLLFAIYTRTSRDEQTAHCALLGKWFSAAGYRPELERFADALLETLIQTFGSVGPLHPMFQRLESLTPEAFRSLQELYPKRKAGRTLTAAERELWLSLPFMMSAEQLDLPLPKDIAAAVLAVRDECIERFGERLHSQFKPLDPQGHNPGLSVLENLLFGRFSHAGETSERRVRQLVADELEQVGLRSPLSLLLRSIQVGIGGADVPPTSQERFAFLRATIKRPDILVLDQALASHSPRQRFQTLRRVRQLLPETTIFVLEPAFSDTGLYDLTIRLQDGRALLARDSAETADTPIPEDFENKRKVIAGVDTFAHLDQPQIRLLAYASRWMRVEAGEYLFRAGDFPDGAYIIVEGLAQVRWPNPRDDEEPVTEAGAGRLIGDLAVLLDQPRTMDLIAVQPVVALRLERRGLLQIVENDVVVATSLLRTVSGHLFRASERMRERRREKT